MAAKVQCPGCFEEIVAGETDRGSSLTCGSCGTAVPVPSVDFPRPKLRRIKPVKNRRVFLWLVLISAVLFLTLLTGGALGYIFRERVADVVTGRGGPSSDPEIPRHWRRAKGDGFTMYVPSEVPRRQPDERLQVGMDFHTSRSYRYSDRGELDSYQIAVVVCTLGNDLLNRLSHAELLASAFSAMDKHREIGDRSIGGHAGKEFSQDQFGEVYFWIGKVGDRVYAFQFLCTGGQQDRAVTARLRGAWLRSVTIDYLADAASESDTATVEAWAMVQKDGFSVDMPKNAKDDEDPFARRVVRKHTARDNRCKYVAGYSEWTDGGLDTAAFVQERLGHGAKFQSSVDIKIDGRPAKKWTFKDFFDGPAYAVTIRTGNRIYAFSCTVPDGIHRTADPVHDARAERFFNSIKIQYDPKNTDLLAHEPAWVPLVKNAGFSISAPEEGTAAPHRLGFAKDAIDGMGYKCEKDAIVYEAYQYKLPLSRPDDTDLQIFLIGGTTKPVAPKAIVDGREVSDYRSQDLFQRSFFVRVIRADDRVFVLKLAVKFVAKKISESELEARKAKFFDSFRIDADKK